MKRFDWWFLISLLLSAVVLGMGIRRLLDKTYTEQHYYAQLATVVEIDTRHNEVVCVDGQGNEWIFTGIEEWQINDIAIMVMDDNQTDDVEDDVIITVTRGSRDH